MSERVKNWLLFAAGFLAVYLWRSHADAAPVTVATNSQADMLAEQDAAFATDGLGGVGADMIEPDFGTAFAAARAAGLATFVWHGNSYTTLLQGE
jgi:hypothetical protein